MQNDRQITISAAGNRRAATWPAQTLWWSEFVTRISTAVRGQETLAAYLRMKKAQQDDLKDVGGFVGGTLAGNRRKGSAVTGRDLVTLDMDALPAMGADDALRRIGALGCAYATYSTRKHEPARPRLRVILPLSRMVTADEYEPIARKLAEMIDISWCDPTTFQAVRMMYWPSCCADGQHVFVHEDKPFADADGVLGLYSDWRDTSSWPQVPGAQKTTHSLLKKQEDPTAKPGVIGAFCRVYNIYQAMDAYLPGVYEAVDTGDGRYTFTGGSTTGGAVVYDDGKFLFSHHATDPCGGQLVNAFDLVRLHEYGALDDEAKDGTPTNRLPSYLAMCERAIKDDAVKQMLQEERYAKATDDFALEPSDPNWMGRLIVHARTGEMQKLRENAALIMENDPLLAGRIGYDRFANRVTVLDKLPWDAAFNGRRPWTDADDQQLRCYIERVYHMDSPGKILDAFTAVTQAHSFDDVQAFLGGLTWDGTPRLDTLLIDYLNAEDTPYTRAVTRKVFTAAVARAMTPGVKFDYSPILVGKQGKGKSTLVRRMGKKWFLEDLPAALDGKEASERIQGYWLAEMGELNTLTRNEVNITKAFLSRTVDVYREPYGRRTAEYPRRCVIFGSTNDEEFLRDSTGNRRFWPVTLLDEPARLSVFEDLTEDVVDQVWAEAKARWILGEPLYLTGDVETSAKVKQESYRSIDAKAGLIAEFVERPLPQDWDTWDIGKRRLYWSGEFSRADPKTCVPRQQVCAAEIWIECLGQDKGRMRQTDTREINSLLREIGWTSVGTKWDRQYGPQRCYTPLHLPENKV